MKFFKKIENEKIECTVCARHCKIENASVGYCGVRKNIDGNLEFLNYGNIVFLKKDGKKMKVGSVGSNMRIPFDPNWDTSLFPFLRSKEIGREKTNEEIKNLGYKYSPNELIEYAKKQNCDEIVFQYNEPLVYIEYILEVCKKNELKVSIVTTGYFSTESLENILPFLNEISFYFFSTFDKFYIKHCGAQLPIIKENLLAILKTKTNLKILCPVIPGETDVLSISSFLKNISPEIRIQFLKFTPSFRMTDKKATKRRELEKAVDIAREIGLKNVDFVD